MKIHKMWKENKCQLKITYAEKISFKDEGEREKTMVNYKY